MKISRYYPVEVMATGLMVLLVFCLLLFGCRVLAQRLIIESQYVHVSPSGLVSDDIEYDPNTVVKSGVICRQRRVPAQMFLGRDGDFDRWFSDSLQPDQLGARPRPAPVKSARHEDGWEKRAWQPKLGQFVETLFVEKKTSGRYTQWDQRITAYVGPQGFAEQGTEAIGRFCDPLMAKAAWDKDALLVYDKKQRCFFRIDFAEQQIRQGPEIPAGVSILQFGDLGKNKVFLDTSWHPPQRMETEKEREGRLKGTPPMGGAGYGRYSMTPRAPGDPNDPNGPNSPGGPGIDSRMMMMYGLQPGEPGEPNDPNEPKEGGMDPFMMMDPMMMEAYGMVPGMGGPGGPYGGDPFGMQYMDTENHDELQHIAIVQGVLSSPREAILVLSTSGHIYELNEETLALSDPLGRFPELKYAGTHRPESTLAYQVQLFYREGEYAGCVATALSRDGTELGVSVFGKSGTWVGGSSEGSQWNQNTNGLAEFVMNSTAEVLHPMGLSLLSLLWGVDCEAIRGQRALFFPSDSFVVNTLRNTDRNLVHRVSAIVFWFSMPLALGIFLAWRMARDVKRLGLPDACRTFWTLAALVFGPVAYITYRITRPDFSLVTCANCGRPRRADQAQCHLCNAAWDVPELTAPAWRVV